MTKTAVSVVASALILTAGTADALSCMRPNIARTFNALSSSERTYIMALGRLTQTGERIAKRPQSPIAPDGSEQPVSDIGIPHEVTAEFTGQMFGAAGLSAETMVDVTVDETCLASWCGSFPTTTDQILVFIEQTATDYRIQSGPCDGDFKIAPTQIELEILQSCLVAGHCSDAQIAQLDRLPN